MRGLLFAAALLSALPAPALADFFVILHTEPDRGPASDRSIQRVKRSIDAKCGVRARVTQTSALEGINQNLMIVFLGEYPSRQRAMRVRDAARQCVPDAYIKEAWWKGD